MKAAVLLVLPLLMAPTGQSREMVVDGLVYNRTKILEWEGDSPPGPEDVGLAGVEVTFELHVPGLSHPMVDLARAKSDEEGRVLVKVDVPDTDRSRGSFHVRGVASYAGGRFPFTVSDDGTFEVAVYEPIDDPAAIRIPTHAVMLVTSEDRPGLVSVQERIRIVNDTGRAFQGFKPRMGMETGVLATIRATGGPHGLQAWHGRTGTRLDAIKIDEERWAVVGTVPPTGPLGADFLIQYTLHLEEARKGSIGRRLIADTAKVEIYYPSSGIGLDLPEGFGDPRPAPEETAPGFVVSVGEDVASGEQIQIGIDLASGLLLRLTIGIAAVFLFALALAYVGARAGGRAVEPGADAEPIARRIARLDVRNARGEIDPGVYAREREAILREAMAARAIGDGGRGGPTLSPEIVRLLEKIDAVEEGEAAEAVKEGRRQAYLGEILEVLRRQRGGGSSGGGSADG